MTLLVFLIKDLLDTLLDDPFEILDEDFFEISFENLSNESALLSPSCFLTILPFLIITIVGNE
jgi:hypothetical protein